jgi:hypothetical protein
LGKIGGFIFVGWEKYCNECKFVFERGVVLLNNKDREVYTRKLKGDDYSRGKPEEGLSGSLF